MNTTSSTSPLDPPESLPFSIRCLYHKSPHAESANVPSNAVKNVLFRHPGYRDNNILFSLSTLDGPGGVHHETARIACASLANSRWDGFLSTTRDGPATFTGPDDVLTRPSYYFRLPNNVDERYPVVPDFASFRFPHDKLPSSWLHPDLVIPEATDQPREAGFASIVLVRTQTLDQTVREMSGDQYLAEFGPRSTSGLQSRSKSHKKRTRDSSAPDNDEVEGSEDETGDEEPRGRPLKRWRGDTRSSWALPSPAERSVEG